MPTKPAKKVVVPDWAQDAIWYQIFPERFRNGSVKNDPAPEDIADKPIEGWAISRWGMDWYARDEWELARGDFFRSVYLRRFGGDLVGVREKLPYLQKLGVNAIYLNPIFMAPSLHKYDAACLHHIDPTFGPDRAGDMQLLARAGETDDPGTWIWTAADRYFIDLVAEIHRRGMKVIIDGVFNHVGTRFFAFRDVVEKGRKSRYANWFRITKWNRNGTFDYLGWFGHKGLPELARTSEDMAGPVKDYLFAITRRWMDPDGDGDPSDGVDGWRLDVAFCVPHGFWKSWRRLVKKINPQAYTTAEIVELASDYLKGDEFDAVMNYMWLFPTVRFFSKGPQPITAAELRKDLGVLQREYPKPIHAILQNLLDSHDIGRILTVLENELPLKSEWASHFELSRVLGNSKLTTRKPRASTVDILRQMVIFQMTYPGTPMIYYGTEVGLWGANDPDNRQPMLWSDVEYDREEREFHGRCSPSARRPDRNLFAFYQRAIGLRRVHEVFRRGEFRWVDAGHDRLLAFERSGRGCRVLVLLNASDEAARFVIEGPAKDLWQGGKVRAGVVAIAPRGWRILQRTP